MNENNIINALNSYDGTQPSLEATISVLAEELGPEWTSLVFQQLGGLPVELKEKLDHAFNYYASLTAWQETQSYLEQKTPLDRELMNERLPILKHWLDFFGQPGQDLYQQLENRVYSDDAVVETDEEGEGVQTMSQNFVEDEISVQPKTEQTKTLEQEILIQPDVKEENEQQIFSDSDESLDDEESDSNDQREEHQENVENEEYTELDDDTPEGFAVHKAEREIVLLDDLQSWLAARCVQLGDIEVFAYPYYGMLVDLMRQTSADIQAVFDLENQDVVMQYYPDGLENLKRKKQAIDADIQMAVENCESDTTALIDEGIDLNKVKKALGNLDNSGEVEYAGPAPDGFELMDNEPIDEEAVKKQYQQLEKQAQNNLDNEILSSDEKNASQNNQNSVQRKLSFSLKPKKG